MSKVKIPPGMVFERHEKKYRLTEDQYLQLRWRLEEHMREDRYGLTTICSLYFDTADWLIAGRSLQMPMYKEKLRLRSYGIPDDDTTVFLELKKKLDGVTYKRRVSMTYAEAKRYINYGEPPSKQGQIFEEIDRFMKFYRPSPAILLLYNRIALYGIEDNELRVTFDSDIRFRTERTDPAQGEDGTPIIDAGERLMEIKVAGGFPYWLSHMLSELKIYPSSFSKYSVAYCNVQKDLQKDLQKYRQEKMQKEELCVVK